MTRPATPGTDQRPRSWFRRLYGAGPAHAVLMTAGFAFAGYLLTLILGASHPGWLLLWFAGAIVLHDLVFLPLYSALDRALTSRRRGEFSAPQGPTSINHVRVPAVISGVLLLITFPLVFRLSDRAAPLPAGCTNRSTSCAGYSSPLGSSPSRRCCTWCAGPAGGGASNERGNHRRHVPPRHHCGAPRSAAASRRRFSPGRVGERLVGAVLVALSIIPVARYLYVVAHRIGYPYELEWTEGGSVEVVHRVVLGQGIYGPPSMHFTPWPYTPLYFWVSAVVAEVTGIGFTPLRLVSFAASLVVLWLLYRMVVERDLRPRGRHRRRRCVRGHLPPVRSVGRHRPGRLALPRVHPLGARAVVAGADAHDGVIVGVLFFLSFFTKQDGLVVAVPVVAWLLLARRAAGVSALATLGGLVVGSTVVLDAFTHGWYQYYVFDELRSQGWVGENLRFFWQLSILKPFALAAWLVVVAVAVLLMRERHRLGVLWSRAGFWVAAAAGLFGAAWIGRLHNGGFDDVLMPAYAAVALAVGGSVALLRRQPARGGACGGLDSSSPRCWPPSCTTSTIPLAGRYRPRPTPAPART